MDNHNRVDLKIYGQGSSSGGKYKTVSIMGEGEVDGDINCANIKFYGEGKLVGNLKTEKTVN